VNAPEPCRIEYDQAARVARAFLDAPRTTRDPMVQAAYAELTHQAGMWFDYLTSDRVRRPIRVVFTRCREPYPDARDLSISVLATQVLEISPSQLDRDRRHPLLDTSVGGTYDRFRAVHDIVSHGRLRFGFDRHGEFAAWLAEDRMYTGLARWALATELHAEHSVRWTSGSVADHKAVLLDRRLIDASRVPSPPPSTPDWGVPQMRGTGGRADRCRTSSR